MLKLTRFFVSIAALCIPALLPATVHATDITLSSSCELADAISAANSDTATGGCPAGSGADIVTLTRDVTLTAALPQIESDITIEGNSYTISGNEQHQIFWVEETGALTIQNATLADGRGVDDDDLFDDDLLIGGAIVNWGSLQISESVFSGNSADWGGAIFSDDRASLNVSNSSFNSNSAYRGGAIYYASETSLSISSSSFTDNSVAFRPGSGGGAIYKDGEASLSISSSSFMGNSANRGGAIKSWGEASVSINESSFSSNSAHVSGGAIFTGGGASLSISESSFTKNSAEHNGGAIFNNDEASIADSSFTNNSADSDGGAIYSGTHDTITISGCVFTGNAAGNESGAVHSGGASVNGSIFIDNSADVSGGAIVNWGKTDISDSTFTDNSAAEEDGGAIYNKLFGHISISNSSFSSNSAGDEGGAIRNTEGAEASVGFSSFLGNEAEDGGAIYSWGELSVNRSTFAGNSAIEEGGGIANHGTATVIESILVNNPGGDCHLGRNGEMVESVNNHISDGSCGATSSGLIEDGYCPPGQERDGVCQIGAPEFAGESD